MGEDGIRGVTSNGAVKDTERKRLKKKMPIHYTRALDRFDPWRPWTPANRGIRKARRSITSDSDDDSDSGTMPPRLAHLVTSRVRRSLLPAFEESLRDTTTTGPKSPAGGGGKGSQHDRKKCGAVDGSARPTPSSFEPVPKRARGEHDTGKPEENPP